MDHDNLSLPQIAFVEKLQRRLDAAMDQAIAAYVEDVMTHPFRGWGVSPAVDALRGAPGGPASGIYHREPSDV